MPPAAPVPQPRGSAVEVLRSSLRLGLTSFGGPIAHLAYFRREYVERRRWLGEADFADLVALCQALPGPASSQLGIAIGAQRAGLRGGVLAWVGFTLPSAILMVIFGLLATAIDLTGAGWVHGLKLAAVAVVAHAVWSMSRSLAPDWPRRTLAVAAAAATLVWATPFSQVAIIVVAGVLGWLILRPRTMPASSPVLSRVSSRVGVGALALFFALLLGLPLLGSADGHAIALLDAFYRAGALVFGGGHVVLPLLHGSVVERGWVTDDRFLAGYGAAQAIPGPLFTFAAYLGTVSHLQPNGILGGTLALGAIFLPASLLVIGALPFWDRLRAWGAFRRALAGTNAAVVGILLAALYTPLWTSGVRSPLDALIVMALLGLLLTGRVVPLAAVVVGAVLGQALDLA